MAAHDFFPRGFGVPGVEDVLRFHLVDDVGVAADFLMLDVLKADGFANLDEVGRGALEADDGVSGQQIVGFHCDTGAGALSGG